MPTAPSPTPAERFATLLRRYEQAAAARTGVDLSLHLIALIIAWLREMISRPVGCMAEGIEAGADAPRSSARRQPPAVRRSSQPGGLPTKSDWLLPDAVGYRDQHEGPFCDPEIAAPLAGPPASPRRPIRSLCRMLRLDPPAPPPSHVAVPPASPPAARACGPPGRG